ncbi:MAG: hypothetical protein ACKO5F_09560 [Synechococcus sp.]
MHFSMAIAATSSPWWPTDVRLSDQSPFLRNPHDHQSSDTVDTLDLAFFSSVVEGLDEALAAL